MILRPASDNVQFMRLVIVNSLPTPAIHQWEIQLFNQ